jgi:hypothetical protein
MSRAPLRIKCHDWVEARSLGDFDASWRCETCWSVYNFAGHTKSLYLVSWAAMSLSLRYLSLVLLVACMDGRLSIYI